MTDVLQQLVDANRRRVAAQTAPNGRFGSALRSGGPGRVAVIAEHKRASPSAGVIRDDLSLEQVVAAYERGGAAALSILTEPSRFGGKLDDIIAANRATELPILRKDFIVTDYQVYEASVAGADAILLIVAAFPGDADRLAALQALASRLGLEVLMEVHDRTELQVALALEAPIIGINNRNLATLEVDLNTTFELLPEIPDSTIKVAESGFVSRDQLDELAAAGVDAVLIGEALMRSADIEGATWALSRGDCGGHVAPTGGPPG
jgi:indole-3-glycerol phosphate synthase